MNAQSDVPGHGDGSGPAGRAGRDLVAAIAVGAALAAVAAATLFVVKAAFVAMVVVAVAVAVYEFVAVLRVGGLWIPLLPLLAGAAAMPVAAYLVGEAGLVAALGLTVLVTAVWRLDGAVEGYVRDVTATGFVALYIPFLAGFATLLLRPADGPQRVLAFVVLAIASDVGGYATGVLVGRHPMAPTISPRKSWEGLAGSAVLCAACGVVAVTYLLDGPWWVGLVLGLVAVASATSGDLVESMIKRDLHLKDMGNLLPGHGGAMDRLDSLLPTAVATWVVLGILLPPG